MQKYFIRHKLSPGDCTFLSDSDSEIAIKNNLLKIEDPLEVETLEKHFLAQVVDIKPSSIEIEILEELGQRETDYKPSITIIQSLSNDSKFNYFIEKSVEIGIERIIPIESEYSLKKAKKAVRDTGYWNKIVKDATEQSRNVFPTNIDRPIKIKDLEKYNFSEYEKICLATENVNLIDLQSFIKKADIFKPFVIAIGPEKGWSSSDLESFKSLNFNFVSLKGNILRTETTGLVIASIIKYLKGEL
jgi:16S rRNA (uracil1498-N3)-methyltransferase